MIGNDIDIEKTAAELARTLVQARRRVKAAEGPATGGVSDMLGKALGYAKANPLLAGAGIGAAAGGLSSLTNPDRRRSALQRILLGGLTGAGVGGGYQLAREGLLGTGGKPGLSGTTEGLAAETPVHPAVTQLENVQNAKSSLNDVMPGLKPMADINAAPGPAAAMGGVAAGVGGELHRAGGRSLWDRIWSLRNTGMPEHKQLYTFMNDNPSRPNVVDLAHDMGSKALRPEGIAEYAKSVTKNRENAEIYRAVLNEATKPTIGWKGRVGRGLGTGLATSLGLQFLINRLNSQAQQQAAAEAMSTIPGK